MSISEARFTSRANRILDNDEEIVQSSLEVIKDGARHLLTDENANESSLIGLYDKSVQHCSRKHKKSDKKVSIYGENEPLRESRKKHSHQLKPLTPSKSDNPANEGDTTTAAGITSLLQQSADISAQEIEQERQKHDALLWQMSELVNGLKDTTLLMNKLVVEQNVNLAEIQQEAGQNIEELDQQKDKMAEETKKMTMSLWTTLYMAAWLVGMFIATYVVIKIFPKPK